VIARSLVEGMRGRLEVRSRAGVGSTFTVWLPLDDTGAPTAAEPEPHEAPPDAGPRDRRHVLYVGTTPSMRC
jgi:hypothetical protein